MSADSVRPCGAAVRVESNTNLSALIVLVDLQSLLPLVDLEALAVPVDQLVQLDLKQHNIFYTVPYGHLSAPHEQTYTLFTLKESLGYFVM